jgi:Leucine-rich repeat (LRR) protein
VISTRPGAVGAGWLAKLNFFEARIEPMSLADQDEFIDKWYSAVAAELRSTTRRAENLQKVAALLKQELRNTPSIARLAIYPLLCAMICALYRERNQRLPETQAAVCEDLCKMLLHRRERETPELSLDHLLPTDYGKLDYEHKKYIMAELAKFMVDEGISAIDEAQADKLIEAALGHFPDHADANASEMRKAFIERSGLLRPSGTNRIDFLHNTLKEYLAAGRFVAEDQYKLLARRSLDDAWQPVILFAAALPTPGFASRLVSELFRKLSRLKSTNTGRRKNAQKAQKQRAAEFFLVRCLNAAFRLEPRLVEKINDLAAGLFPPNTIADAEVLATLGEMVIPHLNPRGQSNARQKIACIRALRLIGGPKAKAILKSFVPGNGKAVLAELFGAAAELQIKLKLPGNSLDLSLTSVTDLSPLASSVSLQHLSLARTQILNVEPLSRLRGLKSVDLSNVNTLFDLSPLAGLRNLSSLDVFGTYVDLRPIRALRGLEALRIGRPPEQVVGRLHLRSKPLATSAKILETDFGSQTISSYMRHHAMSRYDDDLLMRIERVARFLEEHLTELDGLKPLIPTLSEMDWTVGNTERTNQSVFKELSENPWKYSSLLSPRRSSRAPFLPYDDILTTVGGLQRSHIFGRPRILRRDDSLYPTRHEVFEFDGGEVLRLRDYEMMRTLEKGVYLSTAEEIEASLAPLAGLRNLRLLVIDSYPQRDLSSLSDLRRLQALLMSNSPSRDLSPLSTLRDLRWLELPGTLAADYSPLSKLNRLRILDLSETSVADISFVRDMRDLEVLNLAFTPVTDLGPLLETRSLKALQVTVPFKPELAHPIETQLRRLEGRLHIIRVGERRKMIARKPIRMPQRRPKSRT